jgi:N-acetylmuramoyl-L-alanine amidase
VSLSIADLPSPNVDERPGGVDMLILHYTGMQSARAAIDRLRDPVARVSSHYVVDEDGSIVRLVPEHVRAWHAGVSYWRGRRVLNDVSVGIEIVNPGHEWGYRPFPDAQIASVRALCLEILGRHPIPPHHVVGHSDVAPDRKQDPGELFPWRDLARDGIGIWPDGDGDGDDETGDVSEALASIGYEVPPGSAIPAHGVTAFQRHWYQGQVTGVADRRCVSRAIAVARHIVQVGGGYATPR